MCRHTLNALLRSACSATMSTSCCLPTSVFMLGRHVSIRMNVMNSTAVTSSSTWQTHTNTQLIFHFNVLLRHVILPNIQTVKLAFLPLNVSPVNRISPPHFQAVCCNRQLYLFAQRCLLLWSVLNVCIVCISALSSVLYCPEHPTWMALYSLTVLMCTHLLQQMQPWISPLHKAKELNLMNWFHSKPRSHPIYDWSSLNLFECCCFGRNWCKNTNA